MTTVEKTPTVLLVSGSPRAGGVSETLLDLVAQGVREEGASVSRFLLSDGEVSPCLSCDGCFATGECVISDRMDTFLEFADAASALAVVTPVYFAGVPAQLKAVYDRLQSRWARRYLLGEPRPPARPASLFIVGTGRDPYGYEPAAVTSKSALAMLGFRPLEVHDFVGFAQDGTERDRTEDDESARELGRALVRATREEGR